MNTGQSTFSSVEYVLILRGGCYLRPEMPRSVLLWRTLEPDPVSTGVGIGVLLE